MYSSPLSSQNTIPTRIMPCSKTLTDNIFINSADESSISVSFILHFRSSCTISNLSRKKIKNQRKEKTIYKRNHSKDNLSNLKNEL